MFFRVSGLRVYACMMFEVQNHQNKKQAHSASYVRQQEEREAAERPISCSYDQASVCELLMTCYMKT